MFLLHSCPKETLERGGVVDALVEARARGEARVVGYSGEGEALAWAAARPDVFGVVECSLSVLDRANEACILQASAGGAGVLAKRPLANAPWRFASRPERHDHAIYWERLRALAYEPPLPWDELAVRFAAHAPGVSCALVGTSSAAHLARAIDGASAGPLDAGTLAALADAWARAGSAWPGVV